MKNQILFIPSRDREYFDLICKGYSWNSIARIRNEIYDLEFDERDTVALMMNRSIKIRILTL